MCFDHQDCQHYYNYSVDDYCHCISLLDLNYAYGHKKHFIILRYSKWGVIITELVELTRMSHHSKIDKHQQTPNTEPIATHFNNVAEQLFNSEPFNSEITTILDCYWMNNQRTTSPENRPRCYAKSPTMQNTFRPIPGHISYAGVTERSGQLYGWPYIRTLVEAHQLNSLSFSNQQPANNT